MLPNSANHNPEQAFGLLLDRLAEDGQTLADALGVADELLAEGAEGITIPLGDQENPDTIIQIRKDAIDFVTRGVGPIAVSMEAARHLADEAAKKVNTEEYGPDS